MKGIVFDIKEFSLNDGQGIRTTVFMKGCPLRCKWCHNPEGLLSEPQVLVTDLGSRQVGQEYEAEELANIIMKNSDVYADTKGGVTFSGGEPLLQSEFLAEVISYLDDIHVLLDTSGYSEKRDFIDIVSKVHHVYFDLKFADTDNHVKWTGVDNVKILNNLKTLDNLSVPYTIRVPLIPSITDTQNNLNNIAGIVNNLKNADEVHLLTYNSLAGGKYKPVGMEYQLDSSILSNRNPNPEINFSPLKVPVKHFLASKDNKIDFFS